jgi:hypothetical protein
MCCWDCFIFFFIILAQLELFVAFSRVNNKLVGILNRNKGKAKRGVSPRLKI